MDNNLAQLKILAEVFNTDKIITSDEIEQVLKGVLSIMNSFKKGNEELNAETKQVVGDLLQKTLAEYDAIKESVSQETLQAGVKVATEFDQKVGEIKRLMAEVMAMKPKDGKPADETKIVEDVLSKIKLPEYKETVLDDREKIVQKINTGSKKDVKIDFTQVEGTDKFHTDILNRAIEILDSRTKFLINRNVKHDASLSGSGTDADPLSVVDGGSYTLPTASDSVLGGVKIGARLTMTGDTLSADVQSGGGDVLKVGTPVNNQIGVWTGDGTIEGDAALTFDTTTDILSTGGVNLSGLTASEIVATDGSKNLQSLAVATYPSLTELSYVKGVTSALQTQLNAKAPSTAPTFATSITGSYLTASEILVTDGSKNIVSAAVATYPSLTELTYLKGVTSAIQTQFTAKAPLASPTFTGTVTLPTTTAGGVITLSENSAIALDPAGSADGKYSGITVTGTAGYTQAFGDLVYLAVADSRWEAADADAVGTSGTVMLAMVVSAGTDGNPCTLLLQGIIRADAKFPALTVGAPVYVGETAGAIQVAIPTGADNVIRVVGFALTADEIYFNPSQDHQTTVA